MRHLYFLSENVAELRPRRNTGACRTYDLFVVKFDPWLRPTFFLAYIHFTPLKEHVRKEVGGLGKKSVSTGVRKPGNMCASLTAMI